MGNSREGIVRATAQARAVRESKRSPLMTDTTATLLQQRVVETAERLSLLCSVAAAELRVPVRDRRWRVAVFVFHERGICQAVLRELGDIGRELDATGGNLLPALKLIRAKIEATEHRLRCVAAAAAQEEARPFQDRRLRVGLFLYHQRMVHSAVLRELTALSSVCGATHTEISPAPS